ncbi:ubiquitin carboxyl-terminal hydrolase-domain-containing protein [Morchella snyderi]|nr:ubiquitin carboxyl-terminal hydrolase-domain-containing protein [Morchella snyderi]
MLSTENAVRQVMVNDRGVISLSAKSLHFAIRRGLAQWNIQNDKFQNLSTMAYTNRGTSEILVGGSQYSMLTVNIDRGTILGEYDTEDDIKVMKRSSRSIVYGTAKGDIKLLDMNTMKIIKEFSQVHGSAISDIDTQANTLLTCGYSPRQGAYHLDTLVKVYDLRMNRALPPIGFPSGAAFVRMHPKMSASAIIASQAGQFQIIDIMNPAAMKLYHANVSSYITAMELAPSGDALALMDADGYLQLWGPPDKIRFTELMNPVEWQDPHPLPNIIVNEDTPLNTIGMPFYHDDLLSAWPPHMVFDVNKLPQKIDSDILEASAKTGYAPYHKRTPRYCIEKTPTDTPVPAPKFLSQQAKSKNRDYGDFGDAKLLFGDEARRQFEVPPAYRKVEIKYSKFGVDDFDFEYFNKTRFSGLETHIANSYMNPLLQMYKFTPLLRNLALQHTATSCTKEDCMLCQMGFLFDMLDKANGQNCQATNFLKTFSSLPTAARHGVLEEDSSGNGSLTAMIQSLNRFLLDQVSLDQRNWDSNSTLLEDAINVAATKIQRCVVCGKETRPLGDTNVTDLNYLPKLPNKPVMTFSAIAKQSIQLDTNQKGWCDKCRRYQTQVMRKTIRKMPKILMFNATAHEKTANFAKDHWSTPGWLPDEIGMVVTNSQLNIYQGDDLDTMKEKDRSGALIVYELVGFVAEIKLEESRNSHLISFVNVALSSVERIEDNNWHMFNDFMVRPVSKEDALDFTPKWKMPSVLCYQVKSASNVVDNSWRDHLDTSLLYHDLTYGKREVHREAIYKPLTPGEGPRPGMLVALDAEFVSMQNEEIEVKADGSRSVVRPSRLGLARVSVLRGEGEDEEVPFLDDYIITKEPVVDYLTEFSGIHVGDLDPMQSRHALVPLKVAYKRLWLLLNLGCVFVGHGLLKDFRIINIHVPKEQVVDTVDLFALKSTFRKLSLRFLAWVILNEEIQLKTHDSIEDSSTALKLYRKYLEFTDAGIMEVMMNRVQVEGMKWGFKPPSRVLAEMGQDRMDTPPILRDQRSEANTPQPRSSMTRWPSNA